MPLYEYCCKDCGAEFEEVVPFAKADETACSSCGSKKTERLASSFSSTSKSSESNSPGLACSMGG